MLSKQAEGGLFSQEIKRPCLETSIGKLPKLSTENRLLKGSSSRSTGEGGSSCTTKSLSLASERRQELLSNLTIYRDQPQKIKLDLSNHLLKKNNASVLSANTKNQSVLTTTNTTSTALKHITPQRYLLTRNIFLIWQLWAFSTQNNYNTIYISEILRNS